MAGWVLPSSLTNIAGFIRTLNSHMLSVMNPLFVANDEQMLVEPSYKNCAAVRLGYVFNPSVRYELGIHYFLGVMKLLAFGYCVNSVREMPA